MKEARVFRKKLLMESVSKMKWSMRRRCKKMLKGAGWPDWCDGKQVVFDNPDAEGTIEANGIVWSINRKWTEPLPSEA